MKIYTLTTQYANNMGALLQCYALARFLNNMEGVECEVLQYLPKGHKRSWTIYHKPRTWKDIIKMAYETIRIDHTLARRRKQKRMRKFINEYIPLSARKYDRKAILKNPPAADAFVVGSDQIWNFKYRLDPTFFFDFVKSADALKISYAASVADDWSPVETNKIKPFLSVFDRVSIRERGNLKCVNAALTDREATVVCDPVFLLNRSEWDKFKTASTISKIDEPYIFCYFLGVSKFAVEVVNKLRQLTGYKVVHLNLNALDKFNSERVITEADPKDFVELVSKAAYVCTNSFHASAFSIIYRRNLIFVPKHIANERVVQLENVFNINVIMTPEKLKTLSLGDLTTDYSDDRAAVEFIDYSRRFIIEATDGKR